MSKARYVHHFVQDVDLEDVRALKIAAKGYKAPFRLKTYIFDEEMTYLVVLEEINCNFFFCCILRRYPLDVVNKFVPLIHTLIDSLLEVVGHVICIVITPFKFLFHLLCILLRLQNPIRDSLVLPNAYYIWYKFGAVF